MTKGSDSEGSSGREPVKVAAAAPAGQRLRVFWLLTGLALFALFYFLTGLPDAIDPDGRRIVLSAQGRMAVGLFLLAAVWWVFEVVPIGVTAIAIAVIQVFFQLRDARAAFTDFMDPAVWFIIGSITIGMVFTKTGLTNRMAYRMLTIVGERTSRIYLGAFVMTAALTLVMAHTAVAAAIFPLLMTIHALYEEDAHPTRFGKGLFIGMAFTAGAGSIITLLGAARGAVAIEFFSQLAGRDIEFFELTYYMLPVGAVMVFLLWVYVLLVFKPEQDVIPGLSERAKQLHASLGPMSREERLGLAITMFAVAAMSLRSLVPAFAGLDKSAVIAGATVLFFIFRILRKKDLEALPWNIVLLFGGAMSLGLCLWQTGAAEWMAVSWLSLLHGHSILTFVLGTAVLIMALTNIIMNVAAIAIALPVALVMAPYLGASPEIVLYVALAVAGMPFLFLVGAAPNAIAYESGQFSTGEFFLAGLPASIIAVLVVALFATVIWPLMGMPVLS
ncbi:MAG: SLC13/DASS family transporter [Gammaproteobacteria bacterium]|nr:SLC13/DASS family transporter [Gammaproteobacteria bacterium]